ncbi:MAG TPA: glycosyltransferase family A protein [Steroidobacteraceae bacterium]
MSIILPTFNRLKYLRAAVDSVFAQTLQDWELIIADDGSGAETMAYLRSFADVPRVKLLWLSHTGNPPAVRNAALREAEAEYIAFLDSDDVWMPEKLEAQISSLRSHKVRQWSYTGCVMVDGSLNPFSGAPHKHRSAIDGWILEKLLKAEVVIVQSSVVVARELITAAGGYTEELPICGDYELYVQLAQRSEVDFVDKPLVLVRRHEEHYCDDVTALADLRRFIERVQRSGTATHLESVLDRRRALVSAGIARGYAATGNRSRVLSTLLSSARYSWRYREWWYCAMAATVQAFAPGSVRKVVRRYFRGRHDRGRQQMRPQ